MKQKIIYVCQNCGSQFHKWSGRCLNCGEWNTISEEIEIEDKSSRRIDLNKAKDNVSFSLEKAEISAIEIFKTGIDEFDRVLGGGFVKGTNILFGRPPGAGKSTFVLQILGKLSESGFSSLYVTGEESIEQIKFRANRLKINCKNISVLSENHIETIIKEIDRINPFIVVIDSIQAIYKSDLPAVPGSIVQVRNCGAILTEISKKENIIVILIGHITKDGTIAGPKLLEHIVDVVLYFEGELYYQLRMLRTHKNRFGSALEIGVFEMTDKGLQEVKNPSELLLSSYQNGISGSCVTVSLEGTRPILLEIQSLITPSSYATAQRIVSGIDFRRVALISAVLEKRLGLKLAGNDVFVNVVGGFKLDEPAIDFALALSMFSSFFDKPIPENTVVIGELGLGGEIRPVSQINKRLEEARRLGFTNAFIPDKSIINLKDKSLRIHKFSYLSKAVRF